MPTPPTQAQTRLSALNLLSRREHSEHELHTKLVAKGHPLENITAVLQTLIQEKLLSNTRFTEAYINQRRNKGYGPIRIQAELLTRGIPEDMIEHHLDFTDNAWFVMAYQVWRKRYKNTIPLDFKTRAAQMRFLQYRGFSNAHINPIYQSDPEHA